MLNKLFQYLPTILKYFYIILNKLFQIYLIEIFTLFKCICILFSIHQFIQILIYTTNNVNPSFSFGCS